MIVNPPIASTVPPHDLEAEASVLGAILIEREAITKVIDLLTPEDFYRENSGHIYRAMLSLHQAGDPTDHITLSAELEKRGILEKVGGRAHLALLQEQTPTAANIEYYAQIVKDLATKRRIITAGLETARLAQDNKLETAEVIELSARLHEQARQENIGWELPIPLGTTSQLPEFPLYVFSPWLAEFVSALSEALQTPVDLAGMFILAVLATIAGGRARVRIKSGWEEPLNLYTVVALPPGELKSPAFKAMVNPLIEFQKKIVSEREYKASEARSKRKVCEKTLEIAQNEAAKAEGDQRRELIKKAEQAARELQDAVVPAEFRLIADDATPEALATLLADQKGRLAILSPEGGIFDQMAGRYSNGRPNLDVYLKAHSDDPLWIDRKGRPSESLEHPALTIGLAVQPKIVRSMGDQPGFEGRGLLERFLYSVPQRFCIWVRTFEKSGESR